MRYAILCCIVLILNSCSEKEVHRFKIGESNGISLAGPIVLNAEQIGMLELNLGDNLILTQAGNPVSYQLDTVLRQISFVHLPENGEDYGFLEIAASVDGPEGMKVTRDDGDLHVSKESMPLLTYRYGMTYPPQGVDSIFGKSGYIHPLLSPSGDTLSRIQPPDHYHHYGIWGPWTHTQIEGERVDFWNLAEGQGTVLFKDFNAVFSGTVYGGFNAHQEHIDLRAPQEKRVALNEDLEIRVWDLGRPDRYMVDYTTSFSTPLRSGILFEAYRYGGGIGMRFTERWHKDNSTVLTSEGKDRLSADGTNARWCMVTGQAANGNGTNGILFLSYPKNKSHPEPMRVWPVDANGGRGDMFFEFCPIRHEEWKIEPDKAYNLKYRMVVFEGELSVEEAEAYWKNFAEQPVIIKE
ncbi:MAG TPA: PmoA family protein [Arenibacter sp.]|nr:PmoA family protein [Arenibacter sp.]